MEVKTNTVTLETIIELGLISQLEIDIKNNRFDDLQEHLKFGTITKECKKKHKMLFSQLFNIAIHNNQSLEITKWFLDFLGPDEFKKLLLADYFQGFRQLDEKTTPIFLFCFNWLKKYCELDLIKILQMQHDYSKNIWLKIVLKTCVFDNVELLQILFDIQNIDKNWQLIINEMVPVIIRNQSLQCLQWITQQCKNNNLFDDLTNKMLYNNIMEYYNTKEFYSQLYKKQYKHALSFYLWTFKTFMKNEISSEYIFQLLFLFIKYHDDSLELIQFLFQYLNDNKVTINYKINSNNNNFFDYKMNQIMNTDICEFRDLYNIKLKNHHNDNVSQYLFLYCIFLRKLDCAKYFYLKQKFYLSDVLKKNFHYFIIMNYNHTSFRVDYFKIFVWLKSLALLQIVINLSDRTIISTKDTMHLLNASTEDYENYLVLHGNGFTVSYQN